MDNDFFQLLEKISQLSDVTVNIVFIKDISNIYNSSIDIRNINGSINENGSEKWFLLFGYRGVRPQWTATAGGGVHADTDTECKIFLSILYK